MRWFARNVARPWRKLWGFTSFFTPALRAIPRSIFRRAAVLEAEVDDTVCALYGLDGSDRAIIDEFGRAAR